MKHLKTISIGNFGYDIYDASVSEYYITNGMSGYYINKTQVDEDNFIEDNHLTMNLGG